MSESGPTCLGCGYSLKGLQESSCPECGRAFDWNDPETFGPQTHKWTRTLAKSCPPRWFFSLVFFCAACLLLKISGPISTRGALNFFACAIVLPILIFSPLWIWFVITSIARANLRSRGISVSPLNRRWLKVIPLLVLFLLIQHSGIIFWIRWWHAKPEFERLRDANSTQSPRWVGTFYVVSVVNTYAKDKTVCFDVNTWCEDYVHFYCGYTDAEAAFMDDSHLRLGGGWHAGWYPD